MSSLNNSVNIYSQQPCVCVCVYVRKTSELGSLVVLSMRQYRLMLNKYSLSTSLLGNWTLGYAHTHTHTHRVIVLYVYRYNQLRHVERHLY